MSLLGARLDRLGRSQLAVVELASVIGLEFSSGAVSALLEEGVLRAASTWRSRRCAANSSSACWTEPGAADDFTFSHILVRDTAYARLLKRARAARTLRRLVHRHVRLLAEQTSVTTSNSRFATGPSSAR